VDKQKKKLFWLILGGGGTFEKFCGQSKKKKLFWLIFWLLVGPARRKINKKTQLFLDLGGTFPQFPPLPPPR